MKKFAFLFAIVVICCGVSKAQYVDLPDSNFRNYIRYQHPECFNNAGQMDTTCSAILNEDSISLEGFPVLNLEGITYFKNLLYLNLDFFMMSSVDNIPALPPSLLYLNCGGAYNLTSLPSLPTNLQYLNTSFCYHLTNLPALPSSLKYLTCSECRGISQLPSLPSSIEYLDCSYSSIASLPTLPTSLKHLFCNNDTIRSLPTLPAGLIKLVCPGIGATTLPTLPNTLKFLDCANNAIQSLPALPQGLDTLNCSRNLLSFLPVLPSSIKVLNFYSNNISTMPVISNGLTDLDCSLNPLHSIPVLPDSLITLYCYGDSLAVLPPLPAKLRTLYCVDNQLLTLPAFPALLRTIECRYNRLSSLPDLPIFLDRLDCSHNNIYCLPQLPQPPNNPLYYSVIIDNKITCIPNRPSSLQLNVLDSNGFENIFPQFPLCNPTNNISHCQSFPVMQGIVYYDKNNNGLKDAGELVKNNVKVSLSNGGYSFSNNTGQYEIGADSIGSYNLTASAPRYFAYAPAGYNYNFTNYDTLVTGNFALQVTTVVDELAIRVTPINWAARPGFSFPYLISYENTGTTTISPDIVFDYDQLRLSYNTSSVGGVVDNNNVLTYNTGSLSPGESGSFTGFFTLKTTVPLGDTLHAKATITANVFNASDSVQTIVRGAFDPNDKQATPQLSPSQVANGKYIDYTIRFQNTGTDTAFNIVVSDTLNENLQANTLQMLVSSHNCKATVKDNIAFFEFLDILLPDSNVNELKSHGFVSFRVKPQTSIVPNTIIPNKAAIYFDYNAPVITNTAGTLIKDFTVVPLRLISFSAAPQTDNTTMLYWNTANEINTQQFVIEQGTNGARFNSISTVTAKGNANNNYNASIAEFNNGVVYYRLKIVDNDGSFSYSPIIKIDRRKNATGISVLTNPVKDLISINTTDKNLNNTQANIINMQGAVVKSFIIKEGSQTLIIKDLPNGIYYLRTVSGSSKFLKQ